MAIWPTRLILPLPRLARAKAASPAALERQSGYAWRYAPFTGQKSLVAITLMASPFSSVQRIVLLNNCLIDEMGTIDERHGVYSANPPYTRVSVFGSGLTPEVRQVLASLGFDSFTITNDGFDAVRPPPPPLDR